MPEKPGRLLLIFLILTAVVIPLFEIPAAGNRRNLRALDCVSDAAVYPVEKDVPVVYTTSLPQSFQKEAHALLIRTRSCGLTVALNGDICYSYAPGEGWFGEGSLTHFIPLPDNADLSVITITLLPQKDRAFGGFESPLYGSFGQLLFYQTSRGLLPLLLSAFLLLYSVIFIIISLFFILRTPAMRMQIYTALLALIAAVWMLRYHGFFDLMVPGSPTRPLSLIMMAASLPVLFGILRLLPVPLKQRRTDPSAMMQLWGLSAFFACCLLHIALYCFVDYRGITRGILTRNVLTFGAAVLLEAQLINYFLYTSRMVAEHTARPVLNEMAYRDFLTKLPNRADADRIFRITAARNTDFCFIMFDLNNLKLVNDRNGHDAGDRLLVNFSRVLRATFGEGAYLARIGGDEFVAVLEGESKAYVERHLKMLEEGLARLDLLDPDLTHSVACGYAFRHECAEERLASGGDLSSFDEDTAVFPAARTRRAGDKRTVVKTENIRSSESKYAQGEDIMHRVMALADKRMYAHKNMMKQADVL